MPRSSPGTWGAAWLPERSTPAFGEAQPASACTPSVNPGTFPGDVVVEVWGGSVTPGMLRGGAGEEPFSPILLQIPTSDGCGLFQSFQLMHVAAWQLTPACSGILKVLSTGF